jgi:hypothetical protein
MGSSPTGAVWAVNSPKGSWAVVVTEAVRATGCPSSSSSATVRASSSGAPSRSRQRAASPWSPQAPPRLQMR